MANSQLQSFLIKKRRDRTKSLRDIMSGLYPTHNLGLADANITVASVFPVRNRPVTFSTEIEVTNANPSGLIFEFGSSARGIKLGVANAKIQYAAGDGDAGTEVTIGSIAIPTITATPGYRFKIVLAINPGNGKARLWVNGQIKVRSEPTPASGLEGGEWADSGAGSVGSAEQGTSNPRTDDVITTAPSGFALVAPVKVAMGQLPRQFL